MALESGTHSPAAKIYNEYGVIRIQGFSEQTYRFLYDYGEHNFRRCEGTNADCHYQLFTVLTAGTIETRKGLKLRPEKALVAFSFPQSIEAAALEPVLKEWENRRETMLEEVRMAGRDKKVDEQEKYAPYPPATKEAFPFAFKRSDGSHALVQTWGVNNDSKFKERFTITTENPDPSKFDPDAYEEFHQAMIALFGEQAKPIRPKFATASMKNEYPLYVATGRQLLQLLKASKEICDEMGIVEVTEAGFVGRVVKTNWKTKETTESTKAFVFDMDKKTALYVKAGGDKMPSVKPWELFIQESVVNESAMSPPGPWCNSGCFAFVKKRLRGKQPSSARAPY